MSFAVVYSEFRTLLAIVATLQLVYNHSFFKFKIYETGHREYSSAKKNSRSVLNISYVLTSDRPAR